MGTKQLTLLIYILWFISLITLITFILINRQEPSPLISYRLDLQELRIDNTDNDIEKWTLPAIMRGEKLDKEFIEENVYISEFQLFVTDSVIRISLTIFYYIDNRFILKHYEIKDHGLITITDDSNSKGRYNKWVSISTFNDIFQIVNRDAIKNKFGFEYNVAFVERDSISRINDVEIAKDSIVMIDNIFVKFSDISVPSNYAVCFISFVGQDGETVIPFLFPLL